MAAYIFIGTSTVNDRLNALGIYLKSKFYPGRLFEHGRLFGRGVYLQDQQFLGSDTINFIEVQVNGKRYREIGLVVPVNILVLFKKR